MLLAEDLLLLVTDDASGRLSASAKQVDIGLAGANLIELTMLNRVDLSRAADDDEPGRITVRDASSTGDAVLDSVLRIITAHQGEKPSDVITRLSDNLRQRLYERLAAGGMIRAEEGRILGVIPTHRWPAQDARHEADVRAQVTQALVQQTTPDPRSAALIALLHALKCEHRILDPQQYGLSRKQLRARAAEIARGSWASEAVREQINQTNAAVIAAVATASVVVGGGSAG